MVAVVAELADEFGHPGGVRPAAGPADGGGSGAGEDQADRRPGRREPHHGLPPDPAGSPPDPARGAMLTLSPRPAIGEPGRRYSTFSFTFALVIGPVNWRDR